MQSARLRFTLLSSLLACADGVVAPAGPPEVPPPALSAGRMSAATESASWNAVVVSANRFNDVLVIEGLDWPTDESTLSIRLTLRTDVGTSEQVVDAVSSVAADVIYRPWYTEPQNWSAFRSMGSGTFAFTSLTSSRATGRFEFSATAITANADPHVFRVLRGTFDVRF